MLRLALAALLLATPALVQEAERYVVLKPTATLHQKIVGDTAHRVS